MITELTKEQEALMGKISQKYIDNFYSGKDIETDKVEKGIEMIYGLCGYNKPQIVYVDSPLACQYMANILKNHIKVRNKVDNKVDNEVFIKVDNKVDNKVENEVLNKLEFFYFGNYGNISDYGWVAFYDFFQSIGIDFGETKENFNIFKDMILGGVYDMIQFEKVCIVSRLPIEVHKNNNHQLHCETGPAIKFRDGYELYSINGINIQDKEEFEKIINDKYTVEELLSISNNDTRAIAYEYFDKSKFDKLDKKILDEKIDGKGNKMQVVEFDLDNIGKVKYYIGVCPSTQKKHFIGTNCNTCDEAKAQSFGLSEVEFVDEF